MVVILLYWFAAPQQTSACRRQQSGSFYSKFSAEFNEAILASKANRKWSKNCKDQRMFEKRRYMSSAV